MTTNIRLPKTFWWHNFAQFGGALNDNLFKLLMIYALISWQGPEAAAGVLATVGMTFALPFLLFLPVAGGLADYFSKQRLIRVLKVAELAIMSFGIVGFFQQSSGMLYITMFLMATQSAFFGPCKYGILPEQVGNERLSRANGSIQLFTFLAIIAGTMLAPELSLLLEQNYGQAACVSLIISGLGIAAAFRIAPTPSYRATTRLQLNGFKNLASAFRFIRKDGFLILTICALGLFGLIGAFIQLNLIDYGYQHLDLLHEQATRLFLLAALGIGAGASLAGWFSGRSIEFGIVPVGAALMTLGMGGLAWIDAGNIPAASLYVAVLGLGAGLFVVPLEAFLQFRSPSKQLGAIQAAGSFCSWMGILLASGLLFLFSAVLDLSARHGFMIIALLLAVLTLLSLRVLPDFFAKFVVMLVTRACYRLRVRGLENIPTDGGGLLVSNHVSLMDAVLIAASMQRRPRMLMSRDFYEKSSWLIRKCCYLANVILIHSGDNPKKLIRSLQSAREAMDAGFLVCIFAEGALSRSGMMRPFRPGLERIVKNSSYPIIPIYIGGAWGSLASYRNGMPRIRPLRELRYPVSVDFGTALPTESSVFQVQQAVTELSVQAFDALKAGRESLGRAWVRSARCHWSHLAITDSTSKNLSFGEALIASRLLQKILRQSIDPAEKHIGVLLPTGAAAMLTNLALCLDRRVAINLNHTTPSEIFQAALRIAEIKTVVTARAFTEKFPEIPLPPQVLYLEDLLVRPTGLDALKQWAVAKFAPVSVLYPDYGFVADDLATVLFSSGSTAEPKGVMLSHHNLLSNIESFRSVLSPHRDDVMLATLPLFHSFGYTATFWFPLLSGMTTACHTNPLEPQPIGALAARTRATILLTTPSFLLAYARKIQPEQFAKLRYVFAGAEKLQPRVADLFAKRFGVRPLEGYGATELSPVCALSLPDIEVGDLAEAGSRPDRLGRVLPGMAIRIKDPETGKILSAGDEGLIEIKGPNVMLGYLGREELTKEVLQDGWYATGDIGHMDSDGFFAITDRLSRFSKIGGEMVSHGAVEQALQQSLGLGPTDLAVVAVPDPQKGERLCVLHKTLPIDKSTLPEHLGALPISNLWKPKPGNWIEVDELPYLASGKADFRAMKDLAIK